MAERLRELENENRRLREALIETRLKPGVRWVISHLHKRSAEMNHYPAKQWLNSLAFELGVRLNDPRINIEAALDVAAETALPTPNNETLP